MSDLSFKNRLQIYGYALTNGEQKVAEYIIAHAEAVPALSIVQLGKEIGVSNSTITRLCQKLKYRNFSEFQTFLLTEFSPAEAPSATVEKIHYYYDEILKSTSEIIQTDALHQLVKQITSARNIMVCGIGSSGFTANELATRLMRMGLAVTVLTDSHLMMFQASVFHKGDLVIAISNSGETKEVIRTCEIAKESGALIYGLTQRNQTPLTTLSDYLLFTSTIHQMNDDHFINSQLPLLFIVDVFTHMLLENKAFASSYAKTIQFIK